MMKKMSNNIYTSCKKNKISKIKHLIYLEKKEIKIKDHD